MTPEEQIRKDFRERDKLDQKELPIDKEMREQAREALEKQKYETPRPYYPPVIEQNHALIELIKVAGQIVISPDFGVLADDDLYDSAMSFLIRQFGEAP